MTAGKTNAARSRLILILVVTAIARLLFAFATWKVNGVSVFYKADTVSYLIPAQSLLNGSFLSSGYYSLQGTPEIFRTPGYPLLLVPGLALGHAVLLGILGNIGLATCSLWLIWVIAGKLHLGAKAAFWATLLCFADPLSFIYSIALMSETAFTTCFLLFTLLILRYLDEPRRRWLILAAGILGCATYIRPVPLYLGLFLFPAFLLIPKSLSWRQRTAGAIVFALTFYLSLSPWVLRNAIVSGYHSFSSSQDWNLYFKAASHTQAKIDHRNATQTELEWGASANIEDYFRVHPEQRSWPQSQVARFWSSEAKKVVFLHPLTYASIHAKGCAMMLLNPGVTDVLQSTGMWKTDPVSLSTKLSEGFVAGVVWLLRNYPLATILLPLMIVQILFYYALGLKGLKCIPWEPRMIFCVVFLYTVLVSGHPGVMARYRTPLIPFVCISAGAAISSWKRREVKTKQEAAPDEALVVPR